MWPNVVIILSENIYFGPSFAGGRHKNHNDLTNCPNVAAAVFCHIYHDIVSARKTHLLTHCELRNSFL